MARYLKSKHRLCRRVGEKLCDSLKCPVLRRAYPPGVHGPKGKVKITSFGLELREKQKAKRTYGILERQFGNYVTRATKRVGDTSLFLGQMLETRLDSVVYRLGFARTHSQARQLVTHGHIVVNDKKVSLPSFSVRVGDTIRWRERSPEHMSFHETTKRESAEMPAWLSFDEEKKIGTVVARPEAKDFPKNIQLKLIIEHYSR